MKSIDLSPGESPEGSPDTLKDSTGRSLPPPSSGSRATEGESTRLDGSALQDAVPDKTLRAEVPSDADPIRVSSKLGSLSNAPAPLQVVGIGASAGGLEALEQLFSAMPEDTGLAFVVIQHLSPDFKSVMDELLARRTRIPIVLVENGMTVEPNHVYLIPPKKDMIISEGKLLLSDKGASAELSLPIDLFFRSLAQELGPRAIGVVLSGAGSDGARGIRDIHDAGGVVLCQDEGSANFDGMPRSARETGVVDYVLPPTEMPRVLVDQANYPDARRLSDALVNAPMRPYGIAAALSFLQQTYGIDFSHYKPSTVIRRIERRLQLTHASSLEDYVERVAKDPEELDLLFRDLLIGVTRFFRDEEAFACLEDRVIPELLDRLAPNDEVRIWVAGCATGEEAYSIAILVLEELSRRKDNRRLKLLATDVHRGSLDFASRGLYSKDRIATVREDLLARYFDERGPNYQVSSDLRQYVVFAPHNVVKDAPFTRIDLVSCRNLLIYLQPSAQKKVLNLLHFALKRQGVLFLGPSEAAGALSDDFDTIDGHWRIYRKRRDLRPPNDTRISVPKARLMQRSPDSSAHGYTLAQVINVYDALLDEHVPPSLLVNERRELIHAFAGASRFLRIKDGRPSLDLLDMLEPELKMAITGALQRALKDGETIVYNGLSLRTSDATGPHDQLHRLTVKPVIAPGVPVNHLLITIEPIDSEPAAPRSQSELDFNQISQDQVGSLEAELRRTKENLQSTIEELETSNEELQTTNEELLASNEELQSTNEELQSVNEELYTVNAEYQKKIAELTELTNDMDNLLASIQVGTIFLDSSLCIRKFTPLIAEAFNLLPQDIGRPIAGFSSSLQRPRLMDDLNEVLSSGRALESEVQDGSGAWFFLRILPYRIRGGVEGVVLTLIDIKGLKAAEDAVFRERYLLDSLMDSVPDSIYFKDVSGRFVRINRAMAERLQLPKSQYAIGKTSHELRSGAAPDPFEAFDLLALKGEAQPYRKESLRDKEGQQTCYVTTRQPLRDRTGQIVGMLGVARDITDQKRAEDEIRQAVKRRDEFLAMLSHELRNPLSAIVNAASLIRQTPDSLDKRSKGLAVIDRQSRQMTRLLEDLLEVSRITQNKIELRCETVDAASVIQEAATAVREKFTARQVTLELRLPAEPVLLDADPARLQQVVVNLLDNSSKYSKPQGTVQLELSHDADSGYIVVKDDGVGIEADALPTVFEPFVQGGTTLHRTDGGLGVGLTVVRSLVEMHGGNVEASSDGLDQGSKFVVKLPLSRAPRRNHAPKQTDTVSPRRIVLVEDNADSCEMMQLLLSAAGHEVATASDGQTGLSLIFNRKPDVAIIDVGLPLMNGFEVARSVRARADLTSVYLIALTGYGQSSDCVAALEAGFNEHWVKPIDPERLPELLRMQQSAHAG
ncbi:MAG TPA: chemotaxis protein CheB [Polyangiaceae bacterium]|jgi:two-component system CheB/CheR fusion protein|nr:chemotaxis protein CheB [Polyangiaceae bacterium]